MKSFFVAVMSVVSLSPFLSCQENKNEKKNVPAHQGSSIKKTETKIIKTEGREKSLIGDTSNVNYWTSVFSAVLFFVLTLFLFLVLRLQAKSINENFEKIVTRFNEQTIEYDNKLRQLQDQIRQQSLSNTQNLVLTMEKIGTFINSQPVISEEPDHSLVIEFAKHLASIENNLFYMDQDDRDVKRISRAVQRLHDLLKSKEYIITPLLGQDYKEGWIIEIDRYERDESLPQGKQIIFNIVKPEILYKGIQIQRAKIDVKYN